jgi:hypothetical protein
MLLEQVAFQVNKLEDRHVVCNLVGLQYVRRLAARAEHMQVLATCSTCSCARLRGLVPAQLKLSQPALAGIRQFELGPVCSLRGADLPPVSPHPPYWWACGSASTCLVEFPWELVGANEAGLLVVLGIGVLQEV